MKLVKVLITIFSLFSFVLSASTFTVEKSEVGFQALGRPGALKIVGEAPDPSALKSTFTLNNNSLTGSSILTLDALTTGIGLRDKHMKEKYLETGKFPTTEFKLNKLNLPKDSEEKIPFEGNLTLHGVSKSVNGLCKTIHSSEKLNLNFEFKLKTGDFGISVPNFAGVTMGEEVIVSVKLEGSIK